MRRTVFGVASLLLALLVQEIVLRVVVPAPELEQFYRLRHARSAASPASERRLARRALWWVSEPDGAAFVRYTNLYGFRDREWKLRRGGEARVALFGDSFLEGLGAAEGQTIVDRLREEARSAALPVELMSFGAAGFGLEELWSLAADAIELFRPDHVVLLLYANDFYVAPPVSRPPPPLPRPRLRPFWRPRLAYALELRVSGDRVPTRWREPPGPPRPLGVAERLRRDPSLDRNIDRFVDPELAAAMRRGALSPAVTNLLVRSERLLPRGADVARFLPAMKRLVEENEAELYVAYLPSLNQVTDRYLPAQRRLSAPPGTSTLTGDRFQEQARDLADACRVEGVAFLDLTSWLRLLDEGGAGPLYWAFDGHMTARGYAAVAASMARRWLGRWAAPRRAELPDVSGNEGRAPPKSGAPFALAAREHRRALEP